MTIYERPGWTHPSPIINPNEQIIENANKENDNILINETLSEEIIVEENVEEIIIEENAEESPVE